MIKSKILLNNIFKFAAYHFNKLLRRNFYLRTYPAAAYVKRSEIYGSTVDNGHKLLFHTDRSTAAAHISRNLCQILDAKQLHRLFADAFSSFLQVKLQCDRQQKAVIARVFSLCDKRLERPVKRLSKLFRNGNAVYKFIAFVSPHYVAYLAVVKKPHRIRL